MTSDRPHNKKTPENIDDVDACLMSSTADNSYQSTSMGPVGFEQEAQSPEKPPVSETGAAKRATLPTTTGSEGSADSSFAAALAMIADLPLSETEKAQAVRKLLGKR